uniref:Uncharacterized protein n=1 Tax=Anguilla anguilla TaxID=7936 RepID=A0A0E9UE84_ANGAN
MAHIGDTECHSKTYILPLFLHLYPKDLSGWFRQNLHTLSTWAPVSTAFLPL